MISKGNEMKSKTRKFILRQDAGKMPTQEEKLMQSLAAMFKDTTSCSYALVFVTERDDLAGLAAELEGVEEVYDELRIVASFSPTNITMHYNIPASEVGSMPVPVIEAQHVEADFEHVTVMPHDGGLDGEVITAPVVMESGENDLRVKEIQGEIREAVKDAMHLINSGTQSEIGMRFCLNCRTTFLPKQKRSQFCSKGCNNAYRAKARKTLSALEDAVQADELDYPPKHPANFPCMIIPADVTTEGGQTSDVTTMDGDGKGGEVMCGECGKSSAKFGDGLCRSCHIKANGKWPGKEERKYGRAGGQGLWIGPGAALGKRAGFTRAEARVGR
jgi:hypothetical protein